jgi:hypothetical protein
MLVMKKKTGDHQTQEQYNNLKHHTQKITRQAYWKYIENVVTPDLGIFLWYVLFR